METRFDAARAKRATDFFEIALVHTKGAYAREPFLLAPFQRDIIREVFGSQAKDPDTGGWVRRYNLAWLEMGRKNGKSELMAGIALLLTGADDEEGSEVYGVAKDIDQASLVFNVAKRMVELSSLEKFFRVYPRYREIVYPRTASKYKVVPGDALGNLGQDPHGILFDEVIAQPNGELWDALKTGFGARRQPLMVAATTAGDDPNSFAKAEHDFAMRVQEDPDLAPRRFVFVRSVPTDADPGDEKAWAHGNPALGDFLSPQVLRDEYHEAFGPKGNFRAQRSFRQFRLNQWLDISADAPIPLDEWNLSAGEEWDVPLADQKLKGQPAWGGLVAPATQDISAICWTFRDPSGWRVIWRHFLPEDLLPQLVDRTEGKAEMWVADGWLTLTEGNVIDIPAHVLQLKADGKRFTVRECAYWIDQAIGIIQPIIEENLFTVVPIHKQSVGNALIDIVRLVKTGEYHHGANPVMSWQVGNLLGRDSQGTLRIDPDASHDVQYGTRAAEIAMRRALLSVDKKPATLGGIDF